MANRRAEMAADLERARDALLETIRRWEDSLRREMADLARDGGKVERLQEVMTPIGALQHLRERVVEAFDEWRREVSGRGGKRRSSRRRETGRRLRKGLCTPQSAYRLPILEVLVGLGGEARMAEVLRLVEKKMAGVLNEYDRAPLKSTPTTPRWCKLAQWSRYDMVQEGLLDADSPRGVWRITEKGRRFLAQAGEESCTGSRGEASDE